VLGFTYPGADVRVIITEFDDAHILFSGTRDKWSISGSIDRVTGDTAANFIMPSRKVDYALKCAPTQRMF